MVFFNFFNQITALIARMQVKRYIVAVELWFNLPLVTSKGTVPGRKPVTNKIMLFEKWEDFTAVPARNFILVDVSKGLKLPAQTFESTTTQLMTATDAAAVSTKPFNIRVFYNGKQYFHKYEPLQSLFVLMSSKNAADAEKIRAFASLEKELAELGAQVNKNARLIAELSKIKNLPPATTQALILAVNNHNALVENFRNQTPNELKVLLARVMPRTISGIGVLPAIPAIVYWIAAALAGAGLIGFTVSKIITEQQRTQRAKAALQQQYQNLQLLAQNPGNKALEDAVRRANEQNAQAVNNSTKPEKDMFDKTKDIILYAGLTYLAVKILPGLFNNKKAA